MKTFFKTVGIGALTGFPPPFLLLLWLIFSSSSSSAFRDFLPTGIIFGIPCVVMGILGALIGWYWRKTQRATWVGGLIGGIIALPVFIIIFLYIIRV